jgi:hypothetical protein
MEAKLVSKIEKMKKFYAGKISQEGRGFSNSLGILFRIFAHNFVLFQNFCSTVKRILGFSKA